MTADTPVPGPDDHDDTARLLDRLGAAAVDEAPPVPPAPATARRSRTPWFAAAAVVLAVAAIGGWFVVDRDDGQVAAVPDTTTTTTTGWPTENMVALDFEPDPAAVSDTLTATVTNRSSAPWTFDCKVGGLERWQDGEWKMIDFVMWADDGTLALFDERPTIDCSPTTAPIEQGTSTERPLDPQATIRGDRVVPLGPGRYQLLFVDQAQFTGAVGQFELTESSGATTTTTTATTTTRVESPDWTVADGDPAECMLLSLTELRAIAGIDPDQPTGPVEMSPMPCRAADVNGEATYRVAPMAEARLAFEYPDVDDLGPTTVDGADESRVARFRSSGRTAHLVMGSVIVGERAVIFSIGGTQSLDDDTAVRLATELATRLRG